MWRKRRTIIAIGMIRIKGRTDTQGNNSWEFSRNTWILRIRILRINNIITLSRIKKSTHTFYLTTVNLQNTKHEDLKSKQNKVNDNLPWKKQHCYPTSQLQQWKLETRNGIYLNLRENNLQPKIVLKNEAKIKTLQTKIESLWVPDSHLRKKVNDPRKKVWGAVRNGNQKQRIKKGIYRIWVYLHQHCCIKW